MDAVQVAVHNRTDLIVTGRCDLCGDRGSGMSMIMRKKGFFQVICCNCRYLEERRHDPMGLELELFRRTSFIKRDRTADREYHGGQFSAGEW